MSGISEERLEEWETDMANGQDGLWRTEAEQAIAEIRRLRQIIHIGNRCGKCGKTNPVDLFCEDCWRDKK